jgi:hypothetical protein
MCNYEEKKEFTAEVFAREHANKDSFPFRYGIYHQHDWTIKLFDCHAFEWQIYKKKFLVTASFYGRGGRKENGRFVIWDNGFKYPKVGTVWREDKDSEMLLSQYLRSAREDGRLTSEDLLGLNELYINGEANTLDKLARILYSREENHSRRIELEEARKKAVEDAQVQIETLKKESKIEILRLEKIARIAVSGLQKSESTNKSQSEEIINLNKINEKLLDEIKIISKQNPQYDGSDVEISTVARLIGVDRKKRIKANGRSVACVFLTFEGDLPLRKMDEIFDPQDLIFNKAKNLIGETVVTTTWKPEIFKATHWFRDIFLWSGTNIQEQKFNGSRAAESSDGKTYLNCPFSEKDECKALGAKWDSTVKKWYVPESLNLENFAKWIKDS